MMTLNPASQRSLILAVTKAQPMWTRPEGSNPIYASGCSLVFKSSLSSSSFTSSIAFLVTRAILSSTSILIAPEIGFTYNKRTGFRSEDSYAPITF